MGTSPTTRPRDDQYTQAVKEGGMDAVRQARTERRFGSSSVGQQITDNQSATGYNGKPVYAQPARQDSDLYDQWRSSVMPTAAAEYGYGRNGGDYAGFKTEGGLKSFVKGRAEAIRAADQARFRALEEMANQRLDQTEANYDAARAVPVDKTFYPRQIGVLEDARPANTPLGQEAVGRGDSTLPAPATQGDPDERVIPQNLVDQAILQVMGSRMPRSTSEGLNRSDNAAASRYTGMAEQQARGETMQNFIADELNPWLAETTAADLEKQDFAQQGLITPIADYAQRAGGEVGVDPNIIGGWYPNASQLSDAADQRDLDMLAATGMDWSDTQSALAAMDAERRRANGEEVDMQADADTAAINDYVYSQTGMDADSLAASADMLPQDVASIIESDAFQTYNNDIYAALTGTDPSDPDGAAIDVIMGTLDAAATQDPGLFQILQSVYKDYIPSDYQPLEG
jgi:hypothetical protein